MRLSRRETMAGAAGAMASAVARARAASPAIERPNILWLVSEDNNPLVGAYGDRLAHTPHINRLAQKGVLYRKAYSNAPVCAPSRFGILTGVYPESCGPAHHMRAITQHPPELKPYTAYLREAGYYCTNNEKTDYNSDIDPHKIWDESSGTAHWRNRPAGAPFMAVFNFMTTHESKLFEPTDGKVKPQDVRVPAYLPDTPSVRQDIASYYNLMERMDSQVGEKIIEIEEAGLADDSIIFYYSDNGGCIPRSKHYAYDEGFRCCLIVHLPQKWAHLSPVKMGSEVHSPVSFIDLAPTIVSLAGLPPAPQMAGEAFLGRNATPPRQYSFGIRNRMDEAYDFVRTVTDGRYRYIRNYMPHRPNGAHLAFVWLMKSFQDWETEYRAGRLNVAQARFFEEKPFEEFYDLEADPDQIDNLIGADVHAPRIALFRTALTRHMLLVNDNGFIPEGAAAEGYQKSRDRVAYPIKQVITLANAAARRDLRKIGLFRRSLGHDNEVIRYWAAMGLLMLGKEAMPAKADIIGALDEDSSPYVQITAAEALAHLGDADDAVTKLARLVMPEQPFPVRLQAISALTFIGEAAYPLLPLISKIAQEDQLQLRTAARYLKAMLEGSYQPNDPIFDLPWFREQIKKGSTG